jgi:hypothetical protein
VLVFLGSTFLGGHAGGTGGGSVLSVAQCTPRNQTGD